MTIDEAIENLKYDIEIDMYIHDIAPQLAEWLEELKDYRDKNKMVVKIDCVNSEEFNDIAVKLAKEQYNKAIDDFIHECDKYCGFYSGDNKNLTREAMLSIAEQLKVGGENEI